MRVPPSYRPTPLADLPLFERTEAHARNTDPQTSKDAARRVRAKELETRVLAVLRLASEGKTTHEIAAILGKEVISVSPRIAPLRRKGLVKGGPVKDGRTIWLAVDHA